MKFFKIYLNALIITAFFILITGWNISAIKDDDFWLHLKTGEYIWETSTIPETDIFLNSPQEKPWIIHSWLSALIFYAINSATGINGIIFFKTVIMFFAFSAVFISVYKLADNFFVSFLLTFFVFFSASQRIVSCRTLIFSFMLFPALFLVLLNYASTGKKKYLYLIPPVFLIWVNLHGEFLAGIIFLFAYTTGYCIDNFKKRNFSLNLIFVMIFSFLATFLNPYFYKIYTHIFMFAHSNLYMGRNSEWAPLIISRSKFYITLTVSVLFFSLIYFRKLRFSVFIPFIIFAVMAISKRRFEYYSCTCAVFVVASLFSRVKESIKFSFPEYIKIFTQFAFLVFIIFLIREAASQNMLFKLGVDKKMYPDGAIGFIKRFKPEGKMVNYREWGGYILYHLYPSYKVFIDGRIPESAGDTTIAYEAIAEAKPDFEKYLDKYNIDIIIANYIVFRRAPDDPIQPIAYNPGWSLVFWDDNSLVYLRNIEKNKKIIAENKFSAIIPSSTLTPFQTNDIELALTECKRAVSIAPSERGYIFMGFLYRKKGLLPEAITSFRYAISINPESYMGYFNIGAAYLQLNNIHEALKYLHKSIEINPSYQKAKELIGSINSLQ